MQIDLLVNDSLRNKIRNIIVEFEGDRRKFINQLCNEKYNKTCSHNEKIFVIFGREFEVVLAMEEALMETILYKFDFVIREIRRNSNDDIIRKEDVKLNYDYFYTLNEEFKRTDSHENYTIDDVAKSFRKWFEKHMEKSYIA